MVNSLLSHALFSAVTKEKITSCIDDKLIRCEKIGTGEHPLSSHGINRGLRLILSGQLSVFRKGNGIPIRINTLKRGDLWGAATLFNNSDEPVTIITAEKPTEMIFLSENAITRLISENASFALSYAAFLTDRIRFLNYRIAGLSGQSAEEKVARYLLDHPDSDRFGGKKLAESLGISRASLYRIYDEMEHKGFIRKNDNSFVVLDKTGLNNIIQENTNA